MKNELLNTNKEVTEPNSQNTMAFSEEAFSEFLKQQRYSKKHRKSLISASRNLLTVYPIESLIAGFENKQFLKDIGKELREKHHPDIAKITLTSAYRLRDYLLQDSYIINQPNFRTHGHFLEVEKELHRYVYVERKFGEVYADRILKIFKDMVDFLFSTGLSNLSEIDQFFILKFLTTLAANKTRMSNLRVLLRFLFREGYIKADYSPIILSVRSKDSEVRKFLSSENVESLLGTIDRQTVSGKQDYLFFILMARLGLRGIEILRLKFQDIDWENSRLFIHGKHNYQTTLPFSHEIGEALIDYLKHSKRGSDEHVFITMRAPYRKLVRNKKFSAALRVMYKKSGINPPTKKHYINVFRHSLATNSLNSGCSIRDVKAIMRHENVETTMVYAKYNLPSLMELAAEWPGAVK